MKTFLILVLCLFSLSTQEKKEITLDRIFQSGDFRSEWFGQARWMTNGTDYTKLERSSSDIGYIDLVKYNAKTGDRNVLIPATAVVPSGEKSPVRIEDYFWTDDESKALIYTNSKRVWRRNTRGDYYYYDLKKRELKQLGKGLPESSLMFAKFSKDNKSVAYVSKHNIYVEDIKTNKITQLTFDGNDKIINGTFDWAYEEEFGCRDGFRWSPDGKTIAFWQIDASSIREFLMINNTDSTYSFTIPIQYPKVGEPPAKAKLGTIDLNSKKIKYFNVPGDSEKFYLPRIMWHPSSDYFMIQQIPRVQNTIKIYTANRKTMKVNHIYTDKDDAWIDAVNDWTWFGNGKEFLWVSQKEGWRQIYKISANGKKETKITKEAFDVINIVSINKELNKVYFIASPDNPTQRYLYEINLDGRSKAKRVSPMDQAGTHRYQISTNAKYAFQWYNNASTPDFVRLVELQNHQTVRDIATNSRLKKELENTNLSKPEFFSVKTAEGVTMEAYMIKPSNFDKTKKYPVIFHVYGEPAGQTAKDSWGGRNFLWHNMMAQKGYIVISTDNRGTPSPKGREWRKSIYRKIGVISSIDQHGAAQEIMKWDFIDKDRIGIWGWSGGGSMTLNMLFRYPNVYKTGVSIAPVSYQMNYDNIYQERYMGVPSSNLQDFIDGSPITYAKNLEGNLLLIHGTGDDNVHYQNAEMLINELIKNNKVFQVMPYPNRSHGIWEGENTSRHLYKTMTEYFLNNLEAGSK